jgi:hypothetical protein
MPIPRSPRKLPPTPELIVLVRSGTPTREIARRYRTSKPAIYRAFYRSSLRLVGKQFAIDLTVGFGTEARRQRIAQAALAEAERIVRESESTAS